MKHFIRITAGPYAGTIYEFPSKKAATSWAKEMEKLRPYSTDYGNERDAFPEVHLQGDRRASPPPRALHDHARIIHQEPTGRPVFAEHERDHHITTAGRRALTPSQFALPPGPKEKRRGIKGRLPIDTLARARNALARAAQMKKSGHLNAGQIATVQRKVHAAWPSIEV